MALVAVHGDEPRPLFAFAGIWMRYRPLKKSGESVDQDVFAFMTTEPNALTASINHKRMPVLITNPADFETWLSAPAHEAFNWRAAMRPSRCGSFSRAPSARICWRREAAPLPAFSRHCAVRFRRC